MSEPEERLDGVRTEVRRVGDVIHRSSGPWSVAVQALLRHLEAAGFTGAPRVVGDGFDDDEGRETITFVEGDMAPTIWSVDGIRAMGELLRSLHDASTGFTPPDGATWQPWFTRSVSTDAVYGHGDVGPWNVLAVDGLPVAFIDWEFAGPVDRLDEVAQAGWLHAQLHDDLVAELQELPSPEDRAQLLRAFVDGYGLSATERVGLVTRMVDFAVRDAANEMTQENVLKMAKRPTGPDDPGWGVAWRIRAAAWLVEHRALLEAALV